ncbi:MAG: VWA domain-containing protein [Eubacterium sp.]|nr:VWA domain-containing protein [Eubacterium sp.]
MLRERKSGSGILEVVFILDRSGSMSGLEADTIGGFNSTLAAQKKEHDNIIWSTILFDDKVEVIHDRMPAQTVKELTDREYYVRGMTALLDAVGSAIDHTAAVHRNTKPEFVPEKTLFVITTDGMENASMEYTYEQVRRKISREQEKHGWEFLFLGANIDAVAEAGRIGIMPSRAASFINDGEGIRNNYSAVSDAMCSMAGMKDMEECVLDKVRADYKKRGGR